MTLSILAATGVVVLRSETEEDLFTLGRIAAKFKSSHYYTEIPEAGLRRVSKEVRIDLKELIERIAM